MEKHKNHKTMRQQYNSPTVILTSLLVLVVGLGRCCCTAFSTLSKVSLLQQHQSNNVIFAQQQQKQQERRPPLLSTTTTQLFVGGGMSDREREIRFKIQKLKKQGLINKKNNDEFDGMDKDIDDYDEKETDYNKKIRQKLGPKKSKLLGFASDDDDDDNMSMIKSKTTAAQQQQQRTGKIGSLQKTTAEDISTKNVLAKEDSYDDSETTIKCEDDDDDDVLEEEDEDLLELVARKMQEKEQQESEERLARDIEQTRSRAREREEREKQQQQQEQLSSIRSLDNTSSKQQQLTTGVGGSWTKDNGEGTTSTEDVYQPKTGSWGAFPRPRDISKAYGGGRRVGPGYSNEAEKLRSEEETRLRLQNYRVKMGIDVAAEKENADEIDSALNIASLAMQRGIYATAVSALEKVTKYCSTNSPVGGKVFLELAMAYEAVGRTQEAKTVYTKLTTSRTEKIKINAKRLLYGLEAMQFMRQTVGSPEFSRKKISSTFIDTTELGNIASKFDDRYETAYVDLSSKGNFYKKLSESVVRSPREARQVLLAATGPGEVDRLRIVQALRSLSRKFDDALREEIELNEPIQEPVAVIDGKPIMQRPQPRQKLQQQLDDVDDDDYDEDLNELMSLDEYILKDPQEMKRKLAGEWKLQLLADKRGDGVKFFNETLAWQIFDTDTMSFQSAGQSAFQLNVQQSGNILFNDKRRILRRSDVQVDGGTTKNVGGMLAGFVMGAIGNKGIGGSVGAMNMPQQIVMVDTILLMTRNVPSVVKLSKSSKATTNKEDEKDYFAVWRRVESGTYSSF